MIYTKSDERKHNCQIYKHHTIQKICVHIIRDIEKNDFK